MRLRNGLEAVGNKLEGSVLPLLNPSRYKKNVTLGYKVTVFGDRSVKGGNADTAAHILGYDIGHNAVVFNASGLDRGQH